jgi:hypothetical protein
MAQPPLSASGGALTQRALAVSQTKPDAQSVLATHWVKQAPSASLHA